MSDHISRLVDQAMGVHISGGDGISKSEFVGRVHGLATRLGLALEYPHRESYGFASYDLRQHAREMAQARGERAQPTLADQWRVDIEVHRAGHTTLTLPDLVSNVARVAALSGWMDAETNFREWTRPGRCESYRPERRVAPSDFPPLSEIAEGGEVPMVARTSRGEPVTCKRYAARFRVTRELALGDSSGLLVTSPRAAGAAAARTVQETITALLLSNPTLTSDATALFDTSHGNLAASGAAPTVATFSAAAKALRTQTGGSGEVLGIAPAVLMVPGSLEAEARVLCASWNSALGDRPGDVRCVVNPWLDGDAAWYVVADARRHDVAEIAYLGGAQEPVIEQARSWETDGAEFRIGMDFAALFLDHRAIFKNPGA